jgi:hypothetical protein
VLSIAVEEIFPSRGDTILTGRERGSGRVWTSLRAGRLRDQRLGLQFLRYGPSLNIHDPDVQHGPSLNIHDPDVQRYLLLADQPGRLGGHSTANQ